MQEMTTGVCNSATTPSTSATASDTTGIYAGNTNYVPEKSLIDKRDNKKYTVRKLADENCWMTQDLKLIWSAGQKIEASDGNGGIYYWTTPNATNTWEDSNDVAYAYNYFASDATRGVSYNFSAVTAGVGTSTVTNKYISQSICPQGWRLPDTKGNKSLYNLLGTKYGIANNTVSYNRLMSFPFDYKYIGHYNGSGGGGINRVSDGLYNRTGYASSSTRADNLGAFSSGSGVFSVMLNENNGRIYGFGARCLSV